VASDWLARWPGVRPREPLAPHTYYGIGGPADYYLPVHDESGLPELLRRLHVEGTPYVVLGWVTNSLVRDGGVEGLVLQMLTRRLQIAGPRVTVSAGYLMPKLAVDTAKAGLARLEFGAGIPGSVGGSVVGNAGAFGSEVKDVLDSTRLLTPEGKERNFDNRECRFAYRESRFKGNDHAGWVVLDATFELTPGDPSAGRARIQEIQRERRRTQPTARRSLGSVFKNPPGDAAGRLIEACGLKGQRAGGAQISDEHANFIVNLGGARGGDVLALMDAMRGRVQERFGITLEPEIRIVGRDSAPQRANA
jgi:UDP-N-acetylmuramate dehydrogenase